MWRSVSAGYNNKSQRMECVNVSVAARCGSASSACDVTSGAQQMVRRVQQIARAHRHRPCRIETYQALDPLLWLLFAGRKVVVRVQRVGSRERVRVNAMQRRCGRLTG